MSVSVVSGFDTKGLQGFGWQSVSETRCPVPHVEDQRS